MDAVHASRVVDAIGAAGIQVQAILPGEGSVSAMPVSADVLIVCLSEHVPSGVGRLFPEIDRMLQFRPGRILLIVVRFDDCAIPALGTGGTANPAKVRVEKADLFGDRPEDEKSLERIVGMIRARVLVALDGDGDEWSYPPAARPPYVARPTVDALADFFSRDAASGRTGSKAAQLIGEAGIGKTYIALRVAERLAGFYTGGMLYAARPRSAPSLAADRLPGPVLLIADDTEGLSAETVQRLAPGGCDLLSLARTVVPGLSARVFAADRLTPDSAWQFMSDLMVGEETSLGRPEKLAEAIEGLPLMVFLLAEQLKRQQGGQDWLRHPSGVSLLQRFLEAAYARLDETARTLLRRIPLLHPDEAIDVDAAMALLDKGDADKAHEALEAVQGLFGASRTHAARAVRDFGERKLKEKEAARIPALHADIRRWRAERYGVLPQARLTSDHWTTRDLLGYQPYADAISAFIRHRDTRPPLTIGIKGPWGAGKTSLMRMIRADLDPDEKCEIMLADSFRRIMMPGRGGKRKPEDRVTMRELLGHAWTRSAFPEPEGARVQVPASGRPTVWFNPWMYQGSEQVWAGLASQIITQVTERLPIGDRERFWLKLNLARLDGEALRLSIYKMVLSRLIPAILGLVLVAAVIAPLLTVGVISQAVALGVGSTYLVAAFAVQILLFLSGKASTSFSQLLHQPTVQRFSADLSSAVSAALRDPRYATKAGFLSLVHEDVRHVLDLVATKKQPLVVFIDDLDRCSPGTVTQVIEAINLFLAGDFPNCIFIMAVEPELLAAHVEAAYKDLVTALKNDKRSPSVPTLGWRFLDKIIQLPLTLPPAADQKHRNNYIRDILQAHSLGTGLAATIGSPILPGTGPGSTAAPPVTVSGHPAGQETLLTLDPGDDAAPPFDNDLADRLEQAIRLKDPDIDDLPDVSMEAQREETGSSGPMVQETIAAVDRVFADLYSDAAAWKAISTTLPHLGFSNPRDLKRYLNLYRFYAFITQRRRLEGITPPNSQQIAKAAALAIRWPHLLTLLGTDQGGETIMRRLEAACGSTEEWQKELKDACLETGDYGELQAFLAAGEPVGEAAALLF